MNKNQINNFFLFSNFREHFSLFSSQKSVRCDCNSNHTALFLWLIIAVRSGDFGWNRIA